MQFIESFRKWRNFEGGLPRSEKYKWPNNDIPVVVTLGWNRKLDEDDLMILRNSVVGHVVSLSVNPELLDVQTKPRGRKLLSDIWGRQIPVGIAYGLPEDYYPFQLIQKFNDRRSREIVLSMVGRPIDYRIKFCLSIREALQNSEQGWDLVDRDVIGRVMEVDNGIPLWEIGEFGRLLQHALNTNWNQLRSLGSIFQPIA